MNKMSYLCRAERQVRVKANASSPDCHLNLNAPSRGSQVCRTSKPGICKSSFSERMCQVKQHGFFACVYRISTATKRVSTDSVNEEKKCLVKSGKVIANVFINFSFYFTSTLPLLCLYLPSTLPLFTLYYASTNSLPYLGKQKALGL